MPHKPANRKPRTSRVTDLCPGYVQSRKRQSDAICNQRRGATNRKKYNYEYRQKRRRFLYRYPFCANPYASDDCQRVANEVDHIDGNAENNDPGNWQSLCQSCHAKKSLREQGSGGYLSKKFIAKRKVP